MFAIMLIICEFIIVMAARFWFPGQPYTVSLAAAIVTIVYMRWGWWGAIHAVLAGIVFCFFQGASPNQYLIYTAGNLFSLISVFILKKVGKEKIRNRPSATMWKSITGAMLARQSSKTGAYI